LNAKRGLEPVREHQLNAKRGLEPVREGIN
jgi:hypothetical protein